MGVFELLSPLLSPVWLRIKINLVHRSNFIIFTHRHIAEKWAWIMANFDMEETKRQQTNKAVSFGLFTFEFY